MESIRIKRLNHTYMEEISMIIMKEVKDELVKEVIITSVEVTNDLSYAKVYWNLLDNSNKEEVEKALKNASGFIRNKLAERVEIRHTPELRFIYDTSIEYGEHIDELIDKINDK